MQTAYHPTARIKLFVSINNSHELCIILRMILPGLGRAEHGRFHVNRAPSYGSYQTVRLNQ